MIRSIIASLLFAISLSAQVDTLWTKVYSGDIIANGQDIIATNSGGYAITGRISDVEYENYIYLLRTDSNGDSLWSKKYQQSGASEGLSLIQTSDGSFLITGKSNNSTNQSLATIIKTDSLGNEAWVRTYGMAGSSMNDLIQSSDGNFIAVGQDQNKAWIVKIDALGDTIWTKKLESEYDQFLSSIDTMSESQLIVAGSSYESGRNALAAMINLDGDVAWSNSYGHSSEWEQFYSICSGVSGGIVAAGYTTANTAGGSDLWVVGLSSTGDSLWSSTFGGSYSDYGYSIIRTIDDSYIIAGSYQPSNSNNGDVFVVKTTTLGDEAWSLIFGGDGTDRAWSVIQNTDETLIMVGTTESFGTYGSIWINQLTNESYYGPVWHVSTAGSDLNDGSQGFPISSIQAAIDASSDGDTVLVQPGTYFGDINFNGKNIVVGSLFLTTQDTAYISQTVIDGNGMPNVVRLTNNETAATQLTGFTITGGYYDGGNSAFNGAGILIDQASPKISHCIIKDNLISWYGGGICIWRTCSPILTNLVIIGNTATNHGGGIAVLDGATPKLSNSLIVNNTTHGGWGGGIYLAGIGTDLAISNTTIANNTVSYGYSNHWGGGVATAYYATISVNNSVIWDNQPNQLDDEFNQTQTIQYSCIQGGYAGTGIIDSSPKFIDQSNQNYHLLASSMCINAGHPDSTDSDGTRRDMGSYPYLNTYSGTHWYVQIAGNDIDGTGSDVNPFSTIQAGINFASNGDSVKVDPGTYIETINFRSKNIVVYGVEGAANTIIDGDSSGVPVTIVNHEPAITVLDGFTLTNGQRGINIGDGQPSGLDGEVIIQNCVISGNTKTTAPQWGFGDAGIATNYVNVTIDNCKIINNHVSQGGYESALQIGNYSDATIINTLISNNTGAQAAVIMNLDSRASFVNCTIVDNEGHGFKTWTIDNGYHSVINSIVRNQGDEFVNADRVSIVSHSNIEGGYTGTGVVDIDPLFVDPSAGDYHLSDYSTCIGGGIIPGSRIYDLDGNPRPNPSGSNPDMGAYENPFGSPQHIPITINIPDDYATIQAGLNAADSTDTVLVQPGTYYENIFWPATRGITLESAGDSSNTSINGGDNSIVIYVNNLGNGDSTNIIDGFRIENGSTSNGGGVTVINSGLKLRDCAITNNGGGGIQGNSSLIIIDNCSIVNNQGHGVFVQSNSQLLVRNSFSSHNDGSGAFFLDSDGSLYGSTVSYNDIPFGLTYGSQGGGLHFINSSANVSNCTMANNNVIYRGGGVLLNNSSVDISNSTIIGNTSSGDNNGVDGGDGAGLICDQGSSGTFTGLTIKDNNALSNGGGLYCYGTSPSIINCTITNNTAFIGAGAYIVNGSPSFTDVDIMGNTAGERAGAINFNTSESVLQNVNIIQNHAPGLGGGLVCNRFNGAINNSTIYGNSCGDLWYFSGGGGIYLSESSPSIDNTIIAENHAINGAGIYATSSSSPIIISTFIGYNIALQNGGGIYSSYNANPIISESTISNNSVNGSGAGIFATQGTQGQGSSSPNVSNSNINFNGSAVFNDDPLITISAPSNYWGTINGPYHLLDNPTGDGDSTNVFVDVTPWLIAPNTDAPPIPAQNVSVLGTGNDFITLNWEPSQLGDFAGFNLYYDNDEGGSPYENSLDIGSDTSYTLSGLNLGTEYFISVTVYDTDGNESWYSNEVTGVTRVMEVQNLDLAGVEDLQHLTNHIPPITFDYFDSMGESQTHYEAQVSTQDDFSVLDVWDSGTENSDATAIQYLGNPLIDGASYYLRVRVASGDFWSDWSNLTFRMNSTPSIPILVSPIENLVVNEPIQLVINNSSDSEMDPVQYQYFVFDDNSREVFIDSSQWISDTTWQLSGSLSDNNQYWWYARSYDGYEMSNLAIASSFLVNTENNPPGIFNLTYPEPNGEITSLQPVFTWTNSVDPDPIDTVTYTLLLDTPAPGIMTFDLGNNTSWQLSELLADNTEYFWKVVATDLLGFETENTGGYFRFTTNQVNENPSVVDLIAPDSVMILTLTPEMYWTPASDPDPNDIVHYEIHWWGDGVEYDSLLTDTNAVNIPYELEDNSQYFWEVIAMDQTDGISHSEETTFWIDLFDEAPVGFALLNPEDDASGLSPRPSFLWEMAEDPDPLDYAVYMFQVATDSAFVDMVFQTPTAATVGYEMVEDLSNDTEYWWRVIATDRDSLSTASETFKFTVGYVSVAEALELPTEYVLEQNYPNPFNPTTTLRYGLPEESEVSLTIFDIRGKLVKSHTSGTQNAGWHEPMWNGLNEDGELVSTGIYLARLQAGSYSKTIKMLYLK